MNGWVNQFDASPNSSTVVENLLSLPQKAAADDEYLWSSWAGASYAVSATSETGVTVSPVSALTHGPVWQAVNLIMGDMGQLPLKKMRRSGRNRTDDRKHPAWRLLRHEPNEFQTASMWIENMVSWMLLWGNGISWIDYGGEISPTPQRLIPLPPDRTGYIKEKGEFFVYTWLPDGTYALFRQDEIFHLRNFSGNGFWGISTVAANRDQVGHGIALRKHGNATFRNGAMPRGVMTHPSKLSPDARANLRNEWNLLHGGVDNGSRIAILMEGAQYLPITMSNTDAQWLEAVKLDREQVAALFNLPPHKLNALENAAVRANMEQQNQQYLQMSLSRWLNRFREEVERKLLTKRERNSGNHYVKWVTEAFLRGDTEARSKAYLNAKQGMWMTSNEIREREDMDPIEGGDILENPNTISKQDSPASDTEDTTDAREAAQQVLRAQAEHFLRYVANRVARGAKAGNFVAWLTSFCDSFLSIARDYLEPTCVLLSKLDTKADWTAASLSLAEWCRSESLAVADTATAATLTVEIQPVVESIRERTNEFLEAILGEADYGN